MAFNYLVINDYFRYTVPEITGALLVTIGVILSTFAANNDKEFEEKKNGVDSISQQTIGIIILVVAMIISCFLGLYQQITYTKYGKHWQEGLFYTHLLALPCFLFFWSDIQSQFKVYAKSSSFDIISTLQKILPSSTSSYLSWLPIPPIPHLFLFLFMNMCTQYLCISGVHKLSSLASFVTLNLILSVRKFLSLLISVLWFKNSFGFEAMLGATCVLVGTLLYSMGNSNEKNSNSNQVKLTQINNLTHESGIHSALRFRELSSPRDESPLRRSTRLKSIQN